MTIEEKVKAYDEALERAQRILCNLPEGSTTIRDIESIFPELRESEDERVRKWLIQYIKDTHPILNYWNGAPTISDVLSWLEKPKEQKEIPMPNSTELIEMWDAEKAMLQEKDFRGDAWRIAQNAFMDGFARGTCVKFEKQKEAEYRHELSYLPKVDNPVEWSEEDVLMLKCCQRALEFYQNNAKRHTNGITLPAQFDIAGYLTTPERVLAWLKSLRPQWRPSEEQMEALKHYVDTTTDGEIDLLYNDLKKLIQI